MRAILRALELDSRLILAAEKWGGGYSKTPEIHAKLIKTSARLTRKIAEYFKGISKNTDRLVNWSAYRYAVYEVKASRIDAYDISTIVNDDDIDETDGTFISVIFEDIALATALGGQAGETIYKVPLGISPTAADIQKIAHEHVASLVGKKWDTALGKYVNNPDAKYRISDKTREDIRASIQTSINLGEDVQTAAKRLSKTIGNIGRQRSQTIANTETVNSFNAGLLHFGTASEAVGKEWEDNGASDECADYASLGPVPFDYSYDGIDGPAAHPNCRCNLRLIYQNEVDDNPDLFGDN